MGLVMDNIDNLDVKIVRSPDDQRKATVKGGDLWNFRWDTVTGGVQHRTAYPVLFASIICDAIEGEFGHSGAHGSCPHIIKVAIQKVDNPLKVYRQLAELAGPKPSIAHWTPDRTAQEIVTALINSQPHPAIAQKRLVLFAIHCGRALELTSDALSMRLGMRIRRVKRLRARVDALMASHQEWVKTTYGPMLAYKRSGAQEPRDVA